MAEFFVLRGRRRPGRGHSPRRKCGGVSGTLEVPSHAINSPATSFWKRAISDFIRESIQPVRIEKDGRFIERNSAQVKSQKPTGRYPELTLPYASFELFRDWQETLTAESSCLKSRGGLNRSMQHHLI